MTTETEFAPVWRAARPYMRARKNDVHIPLSYACAEGLLAHHLEVDRTVVLLGVLLHDLGWAAVDQEAIYKEGFGPNMWESDVRRQHELEGARIAREILGEIGYPPETVDHVARIVEGHDTRQEAISPEDELVKDADKLWRFTVTGVSVACDWFGMTPAEYAARLEREIEGQLFSPAAVAQARAALAETRRQLKLEVLA
ncbi:HD domain-containing protein [Deinococcus reticulitermitis]|nr:HD domain-containing protein [Deinococcus reticulitermitis]